MNINNTDDAFDKTYEIFENCLTEHLRDNLLLDNSYIFSIETKEELIDNITEVIIDYNEIVDKWHEYWHELFYDSDGIIKKYINMVKYNFNMNKHSKLINLYNKIEINEKKNITISKILNNKFHKDILDNIISHY